MQLRNNLNGCQLSMIKWMIKKINRCVTSIIFENNAKGFRGTNVLENANNFSLM